MRGSPPARTAGVQGARGRTRSSCETPLPPGIGGMAVPSEGRAEPERLLLATLTVRLPDRTWTGPFSRRHPSHPIEVLARGDAGRSVMVADHWIRGRPAGVWVREIASFPDVVRVESLAEIGEGSLYRVKFRAPPIIELYRRLGLPLPFPIRIQAGYARWEVAARVPDFATLVRFARDVDPGTRISWTRTPPLRDHLPRLSASQLALLHRAIVAGYFAVPQPITLVELARACGEGRAAVSGALATIERKLLGTALREPLRGTARTHGTRHGEERRPRARARPRPSVRTTR